MNAFLHIVPLGADETDVERVLHLMRASQSVLDPAYVAAGAGFEPARWSEALRDPVTEWVQIIAGDGQPAGFAGWRYLEQLTHLQALFVHHACQRQGLGHALLEHHWAAVRRRQPDTAIFTLHVRLAAPWAQNLYRSMGYRFYAAGDETRWPALQVWIESCRQRDQWPLPAGKLLMFRPRETFSEVQL